ncbi:MAG: sugar porter family MFS transporter [Chitinophagales bacterium]
MKLTASLIQFTLIAALGGLLFGFDTAVISGTTNDLIKIFQLNDFYLGQTVAIALYGTIIGSLCAGIPAEYFGRKKVLIAVAVLYFTCALGCSLSANWYEFLFFRFLGGLGVGGSSVVAPLYIAEIAPPSIRGRLVGVNQFNIVCGILLAFLSNYLIAQYVQQDAWRWMLGIQAIPSFLFFILLFFIPDSPRWLIKRHKEEEASKILAKTGINNVPEVVKDIKDSIHYESTAEHEVLFSARYKKPILFAVLLAAFNQLAGINAILYYAPKIFQQAGFGKDSAMLQSVGVGFTNLIFTILAMSLIDKFGRKTLMLVGSVGMIVFLSLTASVFYHPEAENKALLIYLIGFIAFFAFSQGAVIWVFISEIFPNKVREKGQSLGTFTHWAMAAIITGVFPVVANRLGGGTSFVFFACMMVLQLLFVWKMMPETKGRSLEKIQHELGIE